MKQLLFLVEKRKVESISIDVLISLKNATNVFILFLSISDVSDIGIAVKDIFQNKSKNKKSIKGIKSDFKTVTP